MKTYHKIKTLWKREDTKPHNMIIGEYAEPEFELLKDIEWIATEKVDGTNIRIMWDGNKVSFGGKTDNAQLPPKLFEKLTELFMGESNEQKFEELFSETEVCLYGEGFGGNIQCGGNYGDFDFVLFDVKIGEWWLKREDVGDIAEKLDIKLVPQVFRGTLEEISEFVDKGFESLWTNNGKKFICEGVVARPKVELLKRSGERIITKLKHKDFLKINRKN